jgi:hypothetical protein
VSRKTARARRIAAFAVLAVACLVAGIRPQVLEVGRAGPHVWVREGDLVSLHYTQSMYGVPVEERLRVEAGRLVLFQVVSSDAALEYLGIETRGPHNASRVLQEFSIPAASVGNHVLCAGDHRITLAAVPADEGRILIRLTRPPLFTYWVHQLREFWR